MHQACALACRSLQSTNRCPPWIQSAHPRSHVCVCMQAMCLQLDDSVPFRYHWPQMADLRVNGVQYRVYGRNPSNKLGANQRDEPANIGMLCTSQGERLKGRREAGFRFLGPSDLCAECAWHTSRTWSISLHVLRSSQRAACLKCTHPF